MNSNSEDVLIYMAMCHGAIQAMPSWQLVELEEWDRSRPQDGITGTCDWPGFVKILGRRPPWQEDDPRPVRIVPSANLRAAVRERDGNRCQRCGATENLHIDHRIPVSKGGTNDLENLRLLCRSCNLSKGAKTDADWLA